MTAPADERARLRALAEQWQRKLQSVQPGDASAYMRALSPAVVLRLLDDVERLEKGRDGALAISAETNVKLGATLSKAWDDVQTERKRAVGWYEEARRYCQNSDYWRARAERLEAALRRTLSALLSAQEFIGTHTGYKHARADEVASEARAALAEPAPGGQDAEREGGA